MNYFTLKRVFKSIYLILCLLSILGVMDTILVHGFMFYEPTFIHLIIQVIYYTLIILYVIWVAGRVVESGWNLRILIHDLLLCALLLGMFFPVRVSGSIVSFRILFSLFVVFFKKTGISSFFSLIRLNPARLLLLSFMGVITVGFVLLMLPAATVDHHGADFIDAFFTSTSATCVTGLIVRDTGTFFSVFGQTVILILIQVGGLGIMTFSTLYAIILGRRLGFKEEEQLRGILDQTSSVEMYKLIIRIIIITLFFEFSGACLLLIKWVPLMGTEKALKSAIFHSVSAFCNAGFSLNSQSFTAYAGDWYVSGIIIVLIVFGGLGFVVINDILLNSYGFNPFTLKWSRLNAHTKLVIITTTFLIVFGTIFVFFFEFDHAMLGLSTVDKLLAALFQSVTFRTAGFNTLDIASIRDVTLFIGILLMFIGASPSSTGGGIKTTTFAVLLLAVRSLLKSRDRVELFGRTVPHQTVYKSIAIVLFSFTFLTVFTILLLITQTGEFIDILFETTSALGTVGLSTGITWQLDGVGKILIIILMYVGRVGPLTVALALGEVRKVNVEFPTTRISVG